MDKIILEYSPYIWWPVTILFVLIGLGSIGDFVEALPSIVKMILPLLYSGLSVVMLLRYNEKKEKEMIFKYKPSTKVQPKIDRILNQQYLGDSRDRDEYLSDYIDELLIKEKDNLI